MADSLGLGVALWSPLAGGLLTGKYRDGGRGRLSNADGVISTEVSQQKAAVVDAVVAIAAEIGATASQVAIAWMRRRGTEVTTTIVPVIGPRTVAQLDDYLGALDITLSDDQFARLDAVSAISLGAPHEIAALVRDSTLGGDASLFEPPAVPVA